MRGSQVFWVGAALAAAGAAAAVMLLVGNARHMETVVVARRAVSVWSLVTPGDVALAQRPAAGLLPGTFLRLSAVEGRFAVTGLVPGQAITSASLSAPGLGSAYDAQLAALDGFTRHCTAGTVAVPAANGGEMATSSSQPVRCGDYTALPLSLSAAQGYDLIHAGSHIDVWATYATPSGEVTDLVVPGILVMATMTPGAGAPIVSAVGASSAGSGIAVLAVTPGQAARILEASKLGTLVVGLEAIGARPTSPGAPATLSTLLGPQPTTVAPADGGQLPAVTGQ